MNRYEGLCCPVCKAKLFEDDDIVVCPDCGAPHHRVCWQQIGHCGYSDAHGTENQWQPPKIELPHEDEPQNELQPQTERRRAFFDDDGEQDDERAREKVINQMLTAGGVGKDEKIGEESARSIALFVGVNVPRYLRVFKEMLFNNSKVGWNWLAFLVPQFWLFSRKCYKSGSIAAAFTLLTTLMMSTLMGNNSEMYNLLTSASKDLSLFFTSPVLLTYLILLGIALVVHIFFGLFGDYIYKYRVFSSVKAIRESGEGDDDALIKAGGINFFAPVGVYFAIELLSVIIMMFI